MKNTKKNLLTLAAVVAVLVFAYFGILSVFGFTEHWGWIRTVLFFLLTFAITVTPLGIILKVYGDQLETREKYYQEMKARRSE